MVKTKKPKIKVKEITSKIKVTEIKSENQEAQEKEQSGQSSGSEESLEDLTADAPSAREFPLLQRRSAESQVPIQEPALATPAATTTSENQNVAKYAVQRDVTEGEIRRNYQSSSPGQAGRNPMLLSSERTERADAFRNREIDAANASEQDDDKYNLSIEPKPISLKRKYPWEA
jgi:hypothetical protein